MQKILIILLAAFVTVQVYANDGITFSQGTMQEILTLAKKENKLIFIDVYTSWCGPCKKMVAEVFPQKNVGDVFNRQFINYKIDAEKGEGVDIANKYGVKSYPTYLFVNGDGQLIYRTGGYMPANNFLQEATVALKEKDDPKPFLIWQQEYNEGNRSKEFLLSYLKKRAVIKFPSAEIIEEVFPLLTKEELLNKDILSSILYFNTELQYVPGGKLYNYVLAQHRILDSLKITSNALSLLQLGMDNYFAKSIIKNAEEKMLPVMIGSTRQVLIAQNKKTNEINTRIKELGMKYYFGIGNEKKFETAVNDYVQNGLMKMGITEIQKNDSLNFVKYMQPYLSGTADSGKVEDFQLMKRLSEHQQMINISYQLRTAAENVYKLSTNTAMISKAKKWAIQANNWFEHFSTLAVIAGLQFKAGEKNEAVATMQRASKDKILANSNDKLLLITNNIKLLQDNKAPEKLW